MGLTDDRSEQHFGLETTLGEVATVAISTSS